MSTETNNIVLRNQHLARQSSLIPEAALATRINVIGCGAIGSFAVLTLAKAGFTNIAVWDMDEVDVVNLSNQFFRYQDIGKPKAKALHDLVWEFTHERITHHVMPFIGELHAANLSGVVICAADDMNVRRDIFESVRTYAPHATHVLDPRMGAEYAALYVYKPHDEEDRTFYASTLYTNEEAEQAPCTAKSTIYTVNLLSGMVVKTIKNIALSQEYPKNMQWNIVNSRCNPRDGLSLTMYGSAPYVAPIVLEDPQNTDDTTGDLEANGGVHVNDEGPEGLEWTREFIPAASVFNSGRLSGAARLGLINQVKYGMSIYFPGTGRRVLLADIIGNVEFNAAHALHIYFRHEEVLRTLAQSNPRYDGTYMAMRSADVPHVTDNAGLSLEHRMHFRTDWLVPGMRNALLRLGGARFEVSAELNAYMRNTLGIHETNSNVRPGDEALALIQRIDNTGHALNIRNYYNGNWIQAIDSLLTDHPEVRGFSSMYEGVLGAEVMRVAQVQGGRSANCSNGTFIRSSFNSFHFGGLYFGTQT